MGDSPLFSHPQCLTKTKLTEWSEELRLIQCADWHADSTLLSAALHARLQGGPRVLHQQSEAQVSVLTSLDLRAYRLVRARLGGSGGRRSWRYSTPSQACRARMEMSPPASRSASPNGSLVRHLAAGALPFSFVAPTAIGRVIMAAAQPAARTRGLFNKPGFLEAALAALEIVSSHSVDDMLELGLDAENAEILKQTQVRTCRRAPCCLRDGAPNAPGAWGAHARWRGGLSWWCCSLPARAVSLVTDRCPSSAARRSRR